MAAIGARREDGDAPRLSMLSRPPVSASKPAATSAELALSRLRAEIPQAKPAAAIAPRAAPPRKPRAQAGSRLATGLSSLAHSYMDGFDRHILGSMAMLWRSKWIIASAMAHVLIPLLMAYVFAAQPAVAAVFFAQPSGSMSYWVSNLGGICMLYVLSAFLWSLAYILGRRLLSAFKGDFAAFERLGRGAGHKKR